MGKELLARSMEVILGRRNLVRLSRFLLDRARLDVPNRIATNGELLVQRAVLTHTSPGCHPVVFDVGAHEGTWSLHLLQASQEVGRQDVHLYAFEPSRYAFAVLEDRLRSLARARIVMRNVGLSNHQESTAHLHKPHDGAGSSSLHPIDSGSKHEIEEVRLTTVDAVCEQYGINEIALLKCDAEGHDLFVLEGASAMMESQRIGLVQFEYNWRWIQPRRFLKDAFILLQDHGYGVGKITPRGIEYYPAWHPELEYFREGNYLGMREDWLPRLPTFNWWNA